MFTARFTLGGRGNGCKRRRRPDRCKADKRIDTLAAIPPECLYSLPVAGRQAAPHELPARPKLGARCIIAEKIFEKVKREELTKKDQARTRTKQGCAAEAGLKTGVDGQQTTDHTTKKITEPSEQASTLLYTLVGVHRSSLDDTSGPKPRNGWLRFCHAVVRG